MKSTSIPKLHTVSLIAAGMIGWGIDSQARPPTVPPPQVKNIILFIGDGMQLEHEVAASQYLYGTPFGLVWHLADYRAPVATWDVTTYDFRAEGLGLPFYDPLSFNPLIGYDPTLGGRRPWPVDMTGQLPYFLDLCWFTDSASSATAWATGYKTDDGNIAWLPGDPADGALKTIAEYMREQRGAAIGVVSTVPFSHATPAAHVSHNKSRSKYFAIANEIIGMTKPEVVIGGGHPDWCFMVDENGNRTNGYYISQALYDAVKGGTISDYVFAERQVGVDGTASLAAATDAALATGKKLFGLFGGEDGSFEAPIPSDTPGAPTITLATVENPLLRDAALAALRVLSRDPDGFFVLFEEGDIDWANHNLDYPRMIGATWGLNEAVKAAIDFVNQPGDKVDWNNTLLIVTADHANGMMRLKRVDGQPVLGLGDLPDIVVVDGNEFMKIGLYSSDGTYWDYPEWGIFADADVHYGVFYEVWGGYVGVHSNELTMLNAWGKGISTLATKQGKWYPGTQIIDNTQIFHALCEAAGITLE